MPELVLGVLDTQYAADKQPTNAPRVPAAPKTRKDGRPYKRRARLHGPFQENTHTESGEQSTGDVATWLENKYHVFEVFYELHMDAIHTLIASGYEDELEALLDGRGPNRSPMDGAMDEIHRLFQLFIDTQEMDALGDPRVPTGAAQRGVNHRLGLRRGPPRPSFRDTGLYEQSFRAWMENQT